MADFASSAVAGYALGSEIGTDIASGNILREAYAGQDTTTMSPEMQQGALNKAAVLAKSKGLDSLGYSFSKQANELGKANVEQELGKIKVAQSQMSYAGQLLQGAKSMDDLNAIVDTTVKDTNTNLYLKKILRDPNVTFDQAKKTLSNMSKTEEENLRAQLLTIQGMSAVTKNQNTNIDNARADLKIAADLGAPVSRSKYVTVFGEEATKAAEAKGTVFVKDTGESTTTPGGEAPTFLQGRAAMESKGDYSAVNKDTGAMGKYQITQSTYANLRKLDPSLPADTKAFLADPKAQDKAAQLLENENIKEIKAAGLKPSQTNKDLYWMFGSTDAKKIRDKFEDNPNAKIESVVGENVIKANPQLAGKTVAQVIAGNVSLPKETTEPTALTKVVKPTAASIDRAGNILENFMQASKDITSIASLPKESRLGGLSDLGNKKGDTLVSSLSSYLGRTATSKEAESFQRFASGFDAAMATAIGGGYATSSSANRMKSFEKQLPKSGQSMEAGIEFLARARQELETVNEGFQTRAGASEAQKKQMQKFLDDVKIAVPFTIEDVEKARFGGKKSATTYGKERTGANKQSAEDELKAAGL